ncbi:MAG: arsenite methyltransferase [bacterium]
MATHGHDMIRDGVRKRYAAIALTSGAGCGCSDQSCCSPSRAPSAKTLSAGLGYSEAELNAAPSGANMGLGCGNPQAIALLRKGEVVVDLGAGGGFDCFLAASQVGRRGRVIGIDMTPEMVGKARKNARKAGNTNVEFRLGEIEHMPVADNTADVILSNCVINLTPDKPQVYSEAWRILKPGGRLAISDVVAVRRIPAAMKRDFEKHSGCVAGAATVEELKRILRNAGFRNISVTPSSESVLFIKSWFPGSGVEKYVRSANVQATKP